MRFVAFIRCQRHKPELKTQTWIRQGSPAPSAVLQPVQMLRHPILVLNRSLQSSMGKAFQESRVATRPNLPIKGRGKTGLLTRASNKSCWLGFHHPIVNASNTPWLCWRGKSIAQFHLPQQSSILACSADSESSSISQIIQMAQGSSYLLVDVRVLERRREKTKKH